MTLCSQVETRTGRQDRERSGMERKQHEPAEVAAKLRQVGALVGQGMLVTEAIRKIGVAGSTYYRWRADHQTQPEQGAPDPDQAQRLRRLEVENTRLRRAVADLTIEKQALREGASGVA